MAVHIVLCCWFLKKKTCRIEVKNWSPQALLSSQLHMNGILLHWHIYVTLHICTFLRAFIAQIDHYFYAQVDQAIRERKAKLNFVHL